MMRVGIFALLVVSTAGLQLKEKPVLKLRGGDTLTNVGAGLFAVSGAMAYISPKGNFENYKMTVTEATALANMRGAGAWQMALGDSQSAFHAHSLVSLPSVLEISL